MTRFKKGILFLVGLVSFTTAVGDDVTDQLQTAFKGDALADISTLTQYAKKGDPQAQTRLGVIYFQGKGVEQNYQQASYWFAQAAARGHAGAQTNLGLMYSNALGVPQNQQTAAYWYQKAAVQGYTAAYLNLGILYSENDDADDGVKQDLSKALASYKKAAYQGNPHAQYRLGAMYANGTGVLHDDKRAVYWYAKAAQQGLASARFNLGLKYLNGEGVSQDTLEGYKLMLLASIDFGKKEMDSRDLVSEGSTRELIDDTQRLSEMWPVNMDVVFDAPSEEALVASNSSD
ncbi:tetratricopeptide repeat protein [Undibacterium sp. RTI2.1]|uniref:tetratricopeptide repeat protein n=1 Tax=unclassified Undibacterium TaxID=2630295 RepID=UPI002AB3EB7D|nr:MULTISPECIES: tetratricopeptide repeat protein [unclassified Undibacterium]MDY7538113.1 tetratricopeptide repeat protein [Undibacterium sp. 5I1]MEB0033125.1 tetratricopeptide repeat protein [Undibacterium sp. RTI2.1]MEB0118703.1 tetratricopeptide repeat protein [Undibacterium sp. RTI2.2]MEB0232581.1 tetratricopeptide repeat protein [Undibacterium sp. 10I3]MEB0259600.1 tetratricopeptide repeat protein [Undibacterium sp. 5I1]